MDYGYQPESQNNLNLWGSYEAVERRWREIEEVKRRFPWWLYIPMWILVAVFAVPALDEQREARNRATAARLATLPDRSFEQLKTEWEGMHAAVHAGGNPTRPEAYFEFLDWREEWYLKTEKFLATRKPDADTHWIQVKRTNQIDFTSKLQQMYKSKFGGDTAWSDFAVKWQKEHPRSFPNHHRAEVPADYSGFWKELRLAYPKTVLVFMLGIFPLWVVRRGLKLWYEPARIILASLTFFVSWTVYPVRIDRTRQGKQAIQFACWLISGFLSLISGGAIQIAKAQNGSGKMRPTTSEKAKSRKFGASASGAIEMYPVTNGREKGMLVSPQYFGSFKAPGIAGSFFGFTENGEIPFFTNHSVNLASSKAAPILYSFELGGTSKGAFTQSGVKLAVPKLPIIGQYVRKVLPMASVGRFWRTSGGDSQETHIVWTTAKVPLGREVRIHSEGMLRFRSGRGGSNDVGQPQAWLSLKSLPRWKLGLEIWRSGTTYTPRFGLMYSLK